MVWPPLTVSRSPVMKDAASDARNATAAPISCGVPVRPSGTSAAYPVVSAPACRSTGIQPGLAGFRVAAAVDFDP